MDAVLLGQRLREIRLEQGVSQVELARHLAISPAYLNLLEKGRRKIKLPLLLQALEYLSVDLEAFMAPVDERQPERILAHLLDDPLARTLEIDKREHRHLLAESQTARMVAALFHLYKNTRALLDTEKMAAHGSPSGDMYTPEDELVDFLRGHSNYFPELEANAREVRERAGLPVPVTSAALVEVLHRQFAVAVCKSEPAAEASLVRSFDPERRELWVSARLSEHGLQLQLATAMGLIILDRSELHARLVAGVSLRHVETETLIKLHLARYFARALLLPYAEFLAEVQRARYDVDLVTERFQAGYETVAHRMCTLADPRHSGVPLHVVRSDLAGNISWYYSPGELRIHRGHGACPRWAVHASFLTPAAITRQYSALPRGPMYFCFARVLTRPAAGPVATGTAYSIGLGTQADSAHHLVYADGLPRRGTERVAVPVGMNCRLCERTDCEQRSAPSYRFAVSVDEHREKQNPLNPLTRADLATPTGG